MFNLELDSSRALRVLSDVKQRAASLQRLKPYFATPFGDMMVAGCFGLLAATADVIPELGQIIYRSLQGKGGRGVAPWDA